MDHVSVRMYRGFLGDCFLLRFPGVSGRFANVLIDCGAFHGTPGERERLRAIAEDIGATTEYCLDLVIVTHEHWDHVGGFHHAEDIFAKMAIGELWLAWTEDLDDELANGLRNQRHRVKELLVRLNTHLGPSAAFSPPSDGDDDDAQELLVPPPEFGTVADVLGFFGIDSKLGLGDRGRSTAVVHFLRAWAGRGLRYRIPGEGPLHVPGSQGVRAFVLGPPRHVAQLRRSRPSSKGEEVYRLTPETQSTDGYFAAGLRLDELTGASASTDGTYLAGDDEFHLTLPFDPNKGIRLSSAAEQLPDDLPAATLALLERYLHLDRKWRRIDGDWLAAATDLALKLDQDTNNTSLALAFELPTGDVLLFPGDAQVGNWASWGDYLWPSDGDPAKAETITAARLLSRTVIYKVGHHGSHNATLRENGLELMTHRSLVALLPVDEVFASRRPPRGWRMPLPSLLTRLLERSHGRVLRADRSAAEVVSAMRTMRPAAEVDVFAAQVFDDPRPDPLWVEIHVPFFPDGNKSVLLAQRAVSVQPHIVSGEATGGP
jgi:hypothetical protein